DGSTKSILDLTTIKNIDWEDIECIQEKENNRSYIYVADIGDNAGARNHVSIYILLDEQMPFQKFTVEKSPQTIHFTYPKGPRDAETIMVDPLTKDIFIVSKREKFVRLYTIKYPYKTEGVD